MKPAQSFLKPLCLCAILLIPASAYAGGPVAKTGSAKSESHISRNTKEFYRQYNGDNGSRFYLFRTCNRWRRTCGYKHGWGNFQWHRCLRKHGCRFYN